MPIRWTTDFLERSQCISTKRAQTASRSLCGVCKEKIDEGTVRVGIQKWAGRYVAVTWHHPACVDTLPVAAEKVVSDFAPTDLDNQMVWSRFCKAARFAVRPDVNEFRIQQFDSNETSACPISEKILTPANSHVHHFGQHTFESIVKSFVKERNIVLQAVSITAGQFLNDKLSESLLKYHRNKARFLLVHAEANLSTLKLSPSMGPCDICGRTSHHLTWIFKSGFCKKCMKSDFFYAKFCSQKYACKAFCLSPAELSTLQFQSLPNPKNSGFAPMKMFKMEDVHRIATEKHGSVDKRKARDPTIGPGYCCIVVRNSSIATWYCCGSATTAGDSTSPPSVVVVVVPPPPPSLVPATAAAFLTTVSTSSEESE